VGKSYVVEKFGNSEFSNMVLINLEKPTFRNSFDSLEPTKIVAELELLTGKRIIPGETLLFLDEIQECPNAIMALRYFKEEMQALHVIGAGSLLEFTLNDEYFKVPVGRIEFLYLQPLSFLEFLEAKKLDILKDELTNFSLENPPSEVVHEHYLKLIHEYAIVGGMPGVLKKYLLSQSFLDVQYVQSDLLYTYQRDFGKYAKKTIHHNLQLVFEKAPGLIAQWFKYKNVDPNVPPKEIKTALTHLFHAGLLYPIYSTSASGLPFVTDVNEKKFKLLFLDIGLVKRACRLEAQLLLNKNIMFLNDGAFAEQLVGQELLAYHEKHEKPELYFWNREQKNSHAEVDYLSILDGKIVPIEVKSGATGRLKSIRIFMEEKKITLGVRISEAPLSFQDGLLSVPFYLISELPRIFRELL
jgi:predicted AAA+ superfamily ATPase